jgi:hypothetical protein
MMKRFLLLGLVLFLSACGTPDVSTPAPTPSAIKVIYPAALQIWANKLINCASNDPLIALYFIQSDTLDTNLLENDIVLELGVSTQDITDSNLFQVGWEQVVVIVNKDNQLSRLSNDDLKSIFSGQVSKWENASNQPIQVWVMPEGDPTRTIFDNAVMRTQPLSSEAMLAPDPSAMLEAISADVDSIGYLPRSILNTSDSASANKIKILQLESSLELELHQPVIAITENEPKGLLHNLLVCLQSVTP